MNANIPTAGTLPRESPVVALIAPSAPSAPAVPSDTSIPSAPPDSSTSYTNTSASAFRDGPSAPMVKPTYYTTQKGSCYYLRCFVIFAFIVGSADVIAFIDLVPGIFTFLFGVFLWMLLCRLPHKYYIHRDYIELKGLCCQSNRPRFYMNTIVKFVCARVGTCSGMSTIKDMVTPQVYKYIKNKCTGRDAVLIIRKGRPEVHPSVLISPKNRDGFVIRARAALLAWQTSHEGYEEV